MKYWLYFFIILSAVLGITTLAIHTTSLQQKAILQESFNSLLQQNNDLLEENQDQKKNIGEQEENIEELQEQIQDLQTELGIEVEKFDELEDRVKDSLETVETLKKISEIDQELLQKYSKVFFLNEHYAPKELEDIDDDFLITDRQLQIKKEVEPFLDDLLEDAEDDDIDIAVISAYRSFNTQRVIKEGFIVTHGTTAANTFSADQGFSEHQLGTAVDFTTRTIGSSLSKFKDTDTYEWLLDNAYKYGFTLSYPEDNAFYIFEPWHWRFVGKDLARDLHREEKGFYDLDQRTINTYIIDLFED